MANPLEHCADCVELLGEYVDGSLSPERAEGEVRLQRLRALFREGPVDILAEQFDAIGAVLEGIGQRLPS